MTLDSTYPLLIYLITVLLSISVGVILGYYFATKTFDNNIKKFLGGVDVIVMDLIAAFENNLVNVIENFTAHIRENNIEKAISSMDRDIAKDASNPPPSPAVAEKMNKVGELSKEINDMVMGLDGPLKNSVDAKHRRGLVKKIKAKQEEVQTLMQEVIDAGYNPKLVIIDEHGNKVVKRLDKVINHVSGGPLNELNLFDDDGLPNLDVVPNDTDNNTTQDKKKEE